MDRQHVVSLTELVSANVFTLQGVLAISLVFIVAMYLQRRKSVWLYNKPTWSFFGKSQTSNQLNENNAMTADAVQLSHIAESLDKVCMSMIDSQYILKDKHRYSSIYQTPLRDGVQTLSSIAKELKRKALLIDSSMASLEQTQTHQIINTAEIFEDLLPPLQDFAELQGMTFRIHEYAHGQLQVPKGLIDKILRELVLNAIRHNPTGTHVSLSSSVCQRQFCIELSDDGKGLSSAIVKKVLLEYHAQTKVRNRRLSDAETHINLCSIARLLKQYGCQLDIRSALGFGTRIYIQLPLALLKPQPYLSRRERREKRTVQALHQRKRLMFVAQHSHTRALVESHLSQRYAMSLFDTLDSALSALFEDHVDLIVADFSWDNALSIQLCNFLRNSERFARIPFVMISAVFDSRTRMQAYTAGVTAMLEKPLDIEELKVLCENLLLDQKGEHNIVQEKSANYAISNKSSQAQSSDDFPVRIRQIIESRCTEEGLKVADIAEELCVSERTVNRKMKHYLGVSFKHYLKQVRAEKAKTMLEQGMSIVEVSYELGFSSSSYFGQCFKDVYGYPPSMLSKVAS